MSSINKRNYVAKYSKQFNRAQVMECRKTESKKNPKLSGEYRDLVGRKFNYK